MTSFFRKNILLVLILLFSAFFRFWEIGNLPYGVANDEAAYIFSAYSISETGRDIAGKFLPLSINVDSSLSPVPVYISIPFIKLFGVSVVSGRFAFALVGIGVVLLVYLLTQHLFRNRYISLFSAFVLAVSPWHIFISRGVWDGGVALFFYLLGIYIFLRKVDKRNINWSIPAFLLGFFSYHGTKVFFVLFIPILLFLYRKELLKRKKELFIFIVSCGLIILSFMAVVKFQGVTRQNALIFSDPESKFKAEKQVNFQRDKSTAPFILRQIVDNKATYYLEVMLSKYLEAFSPQLFITVGDVNPITSYTIFFKGIIYLIELPLLLIGIYMLFRNPYKRVLFIILAGFLLSPMPTVIAAGKTYIIRGVMMMPFLAILISLGAYSLTEFVKNNYRKYFSLVILIFILAYVFSVGLFWYRYYFQFNMAGAEAWNKSSRDLSDYLVSRKDKFDNIHVSKALAILPLQYAIFNKVHPDKVREQWHDRTSNSIDNIVFEENCLHGSTNDPYLFLPESTLYVAPLECHKESTYSAQLTNSIEPLDVIWRIYEK